MPACLSKPRARPSPPLQILFEETLYQNASDGTPFVKMLQDKDIVPGIKAGFACLWLSIPCLFFVAPWSTGRQPCLLEHCLRQGCPAVPRLGQPAHRDALAVLPTAVQVDKGVVALPGTDGETETQGIDDLGKR